MNKILGLEEKVKGRVEFRGGIIPIDEIDEYWPHICGELDKHPELWNIYWTKEALYSHVMDRRFQVWAFGPPDLINVIVFTEIAVSPANRVLRIFIAFGNSLDQALPAMEATLERFARANDCAVCEIVGRPGWKRKIPRLREVASVLRFDVEKERVH